MSESRPDFRDLVGEDLAPEERERLERVHDLLVAAGPPPELPPHLATPSAPPADDTVAFLPRRRAGLMLALAAALALVTFVGGFVAGRAREPSFPTASRISMHGTALASNASATIQLGEADAAGNWPLKLVDVHGLRKLPKGEYYEMFLTRDGKRAASCGTFRIAPGTKPQLNAPYDLRRFDGWIVTIEHPGSNRHPVVLTT